MAEVRQGEASRPARAPRLPPKWGHHHDKRLQATGGKYAAIAALADEWRIETTALQARYHRLRVCPARAPAPPPETGPAERELRHVLTGAALAMVRAIAARGTASYDDIADDLGFAPHHVANLKVRSQQKMARAGWRITRVTGLRENGRRSVFRLERIGGGAADETR